MTSRHAIILGLFFANIAFIFVPASVENNLFLDWLAGLCLGLSIGLGLNDGKNK